MLDRFPGGLVLSEPDPLHEVLDFLVPVVEFLAVDVLHVEQLIAFARESL